MTGSHSGKLSPLIICDLNNGAVAVESMMGVRAEHVYLALQRLQYRYGTEIIQGFTNKGSQPGRTLGKRSNYWSVKIAGMIKIFNNAVMSQYRNICERKVKILKRFLKMELSVQPGPQVDSIRLDMYFTIMEQPVHGLNSIPYLEVGNYGILTPQHFVNP